MAVGTYRGVSNVARKVKKQYRGVGNVAREIKKEYRGVGNVARQTFRGVELKYSWKWESSSYVRDEGSYLAFYSGTETSGRGTGVLISGIDGHVITIKIGADTSSPAVYTYYSWNSESDRVEGPAYAYNGSSANTLTIDCTNNYTENGVLWIFVSASKGWDYHFRIYDILVDGESVMEAFREWAL